MATEATPAPERPGRSVIGRGMHNFAWLLADRVLRLVVGVGVMTAVARYLQPHQYGELMYALNVAFLAQVVATFGLDAIVVREAARGEVPVQRLLGTTIRLRLLAALIAVTMACLMVWLIRGHDKMALTLAVIITCAQLFTVTDVIDLWFQSQMQNRRTVIAKGVAFFTSSALKLAMVAADAPLPWVAAAYAAEHLINACALGLMYRRLRTDQRWQWNTAVARQLLRQCAPMAMAAIFTAIYMRIDQILLRELAGEAALGQYAALIPFSQAWHILPVALSTAIAPRLAVLAAEQQERFRARDQQFHSMLFIAALLALATTHFLVAPLAARLLGPAYAESIDVLKIHVLTVIPVFLGIAQSISIINRGSGRVLAIQSFSGIVISVSLNLWLIPSYGAKGAAIAAVVAQSVSAVGLNFWLNRSGFFTQMNALRAHKLTFSIRRPAAPYR